MGKILTLVYTARNDDYSPDFIQRLETTLNLNVENILNLKLQNQIEIIIIDWGSEFKKRLSKKIFLNKKNKIVNIHYVSPKVSKNYSNKWPNFFNESAAYNLGIKKAKSKFVLYTQHDSFFSKSGFYNLISLLNNKYEVKNFEENLYYIPTKFLNINFYKKSPSLDSINYHIEKHDHTFHKIKPSSFNVTSGQGAILLSKKNWIKLSGFREKWNRFSIDTDLFFRSSRLFKKVNTLYFGINVYTLSRSNLKEKLTKRIEKIIKYPRHNSISSNDNFYKENKILKINNNFQTKFERISNFNKIKKLRINLNKKMYEKLNTKDVARNFAKNNLNYKNKKVDIFQIFLILKWIDISDTINMIEVGNMNCDKILKIVSQDNPYLNLFSFNKNSQDEIFFKSYFELMMEKIKKNHNGYVRNVFSEDKNDYNNLINDIPFDQFNTILNINFDSLKSKKELRYFEDLIKNKKNMINIIIFENNLYSNLSESFKKKIDFKKIFQKKKYTIYINKKIYKKFQNFFKISLYERLSLLSYFYSYKIKYFLKNLI
ncbi:MAG: hypothetical protein CMB83_01285 [Flammeovirgaceae bacterium]|nr:hypothetical protein [Flammeovirgaceae bacterium]|tara:strand:- start:4130 stop:5758 length:1629 start_codon:yes stop_codon:yes gene_type:complete